MFWRFLSASVTGAKASLTVFSTELVSVVIWVSPSSGFELWAHPVLIGPGRDPYAIVNGAPQHQWCGAISRFRDKSSNWAAKAQQSGSIILEAEPHPAFHKLPSGPGPAPHYAPARQYRAFCRPNRGRGGAAAP